MGTRTVGVRNVGMLNGSGDFGYSEALASLSLGVPIHFERTGHSQCHSKLSHS